VAADVAGAARDQDRAHQRGHHPVERERERERSEWGWGAGRGRIDWVLWGVRGLFFSC
jgi:hypothetical protein